MIESSWGLNHPHPKTPRVLKMQHYSNWQMLYIAIIVMGNLIKKNYKIRNSGTIPKPCFAWECVNKFKTTLLIAFLGYRLCSICSLWRVHFWSTFQLFSLNLPYWLVAKKIIQSNHRSVQPRSWEKGHYSSFQDTP